MDKSSSLAPCQPGWLVVFQQVDGDGYTTEPIACWLLVPVTYSPFIEVHPVCALGGDVCDATDAKNYVGVAAPGSDPKKLAEAARSAVNPSAA